MCESRNPTMANPPLFPSILLWIQIMAYLQQNKKCNNAQPCSLLNLICYYQQFPAVSILPEGMCIVVYDFFWRKGKTSYTNEFDNLLSLFGVQSFKNPLIFTLKLFLSILGLGIYMTLLAALRKNVVADSW